MIGEIGCEPISNNLWIACLEGMVFLTKKQLISKVLIDSREQKMAKKALEQSLSFTVHLFKSLNTMLFIQELKLLYFSYASETHTQERDPT